MSNFKNLFEKYARLKKQIKEMNKLKFLSAEEDRMLKQMKREKLRYKEELDAQKVD